MKPYLLKIAQPAQNFQDACLDNIGSVVAIAQVEPIADVRPPTRATFEYDLPIGRTSIYPTLVR